MVHAGLTGGFGSGKSAVAAMLADRGAVVLDADQLSRELTGPGCEATGAIGASFGAGVLAPDGAVDRRALAAAVFDHPERRKDLEAILHPRIVAERRRRIEALRGKLGESTVFVSEAALIFEAGTRGEFDLVVLVTAPEPVRLARLLAAGWPREEAEARIRSQWPDDRKIPLADAIVDNGGGPEATQRQVDALWADLLRRAHRHA